MAAAYGMWVATDEIEADNFSDFFSAFLGIKTYIASSRPTAVNLSWALERVEKRLLAAEADIQTQESDRQMRKKFSNISRVKLVVVMLLIMVNLHVNFIVRLCHLIKAMI